MRILETALILRRLAGIGAAWRYLRVAGILALGAEIDTLIARLQLWRHRVLSETRHPRKDE